MGPPVVALEDVRTFGAQGLSSEDEDTVKLAKCALTLVRQHEYLEGALRATRNAAEGNTRRLGAIREALK